MPDAAALAYRVTYQEALLAAARNDELLAQFDRLNGTNLLGRGTPLDVMIDQSTGRLAAEAAMFVDFFDEYIWARLARKKGDMSP